MQLKHYVVLSFVLKYDQVVVIHTKDKSMQWQS